MTDVAELGAGKDQGLGDRMIFERTYTESRHGFRLELDADAIVPHDPGDGTPAMVYLMRDGKDVGSTTLFCGEIDPYSYVGFDDDFPTGVPEIPQTLLARWYDLYDEFDEQWTPVRVAEARWQAKGWGVREWEAFERQLAGTYGQNDAEWAEAKAALALTRE